MLRFGDIQALAEYGHRFKNLKYLAFHIDRIAQVREVCSLLSVSPALKEFILFVDGEGSTDFYQEQRAGTTFSFSVTIIPF